MFSTAALPAAAAGPASAASYSDDKPKPYALIFGTVYGPDDRPLYGVPVKIRRADKKKPQWEQMSDHQGEFAQRVPPGPADYVVWTDVKLSKLLGEQKKPRNKSKNQDAGKPAQAANSPSPSAGPPAAAGKPQSLREVKVHVENDERVDIGLHLTE